MTNLCMAFAYIGICAPHSYLVSLENLSYRWLGTTMWFLGTKPMSSVRAASVLKH